MIESAKLPDGVEIDLPGIVPKLSATPGQTQWVGPKLGEHTDEVLAGIGIAPAKIAELRTQGVI
jgi:formyl-CoA transferase